MRRLSRLASGDRLFWIITGVIGLAVGGTWWLVVDSPEPPAPPAAPKAASSAGAGKVRAARRPGPADRFSAGARFRRMQVFAQVTGDQAFTRMKPPRPGDWLWSFREPGQTLADYARDVTNRKAAVRQTLHLQPLSDLSRRQRRILGPMADHVALFFDSKVRTLPPLRIERAWYSRARGQHDAGKIVSQLARQVPADSLGLFGLMGSDLYARDLNFVFGLALLHRRAGVFSIHRYGSAPKQLLRRSLRLSVHELGHMLGVKHCVFYDCVMNGTNSLEELDRHPQHLCPVCLAKLQWNLKFDPVKRYRRLAAFYRKVGLEPEARFAAARARELTAGSGP